MSHSPLLLQLVIILGTARLLGLLLSYLGQPSVIGEMAAGLLLGPLVFGAIAPDAQAALFEPSTLPALRGLSELGLVLFMFIIGAELRQPGETRAQLRAAGAVAGFAVLIPVLLGIGVGLVLHASLAPAGVARWPFALFMAAAMSITAFPVLARILKDRQMTRSEVGQMALTAAAIADVFAWILLALVVVLASSRSDFSQLWRMLGGVAALLVGVYFVLRPLMAALIRRHANAGRPEGTLLAALLIGTFACAYATDRLGIHAVFGAFLFGACLPRDERLLGALVERIEHVAILILMPIFFALAGLSTTPAAFAGAGAGALALILCVAIGGKILGGAWGARIAGQSWRNALSVGALMNARGLMELIVIKVGLDIGVIGANLFTLLMLMAVVTTLMTAPLLSLFAGKPFVVRGSWFVVRG